MGWTKHYCNASLKTKIAGRVSPSFHTPIVVARGEAHGRIDISCTVLRYSAREWEPGRHFSKAVHHTEYGYSRDGVAEQNGDRARGNECAADSEKQTSSDSSSKGNELDVARFEPACDVAILLLVLATTFLVLGCEDD